MSHFSFTKAHPETGRRMRWQRTSDNAVADAGFVWIDSEGNTLEPTDEELTAYANRDNDY